MALVSLLLNLSICVVVGVVALMAMAKDLIVKLEEEEEGLWGSYNSL